MTLADELRATVSANKYMRLRGRRRGEAHPHARLDDAQVEKARALYERYALENAGLPKYMQRGYAVLGRRFGVGASTIRDWVKGRRRA